MKHEQWTDDIRKAYKENKEAVDRNVMFALAKKILAEDPQGYTSAGDYLSDVIRKEVERVTHQDRKEDSKAIARYISRMREASLKEKKNEDRS